jgi:hypothetical protein
MQVWDLEADGTCWESWPVEGSLLNGAETNKCFYIEMTVTQEVTEDTENYTPWWPQGPPLWSNGQSSWLQIQRLGFDSRRYQIFWEVVGLERGPLSLMSKIEGLPGKIVAPPV